MGSFSSWHWLTLLLMLLVVFGVPLVAVATEGSDRRLSRFGFLLWILGLFAYGFITEAIDDRARLDGVGATVFHWADGIGMLVLVFFFYRAVVQRLRDAGQTKALAYVAIVPVLNLVLTLVLLFLPGQERPQT
jgi:uncharacterized membrane protein YhaH (DUF805 family)